MAMEFSANKHKVLAAPTPVLGRFGWRLLASMRRNLQAPDTGAKPQQLPVSLRTWKRNSACLMSLYEQDG